METKTFYKEIKQKSGEAPKRIFLANLSTIYNYNPDSSPTLPSSRNRQ